MLIYGDWNINELQWGVVGTGTGYNTSTFNYPITLETVLCVLTTGCNNRTTDYGANYFSDANTNQVYITTHKTGYVLVLGY